MKKLDDGVREDWRLRLVLIKESAAYREFWAEHGPKARQAYKEIEGLNRELQAVKSDADISAAFRRYKTACATLAAFNGRLHAFDLRGPYFEALETLDPKNEDLPEKLPVLFREAPAVVQVEVSGMPLEARAGVPLKRVPEALEPSERILKLDLSRKRGEIEAEFKRYLDAVEHYRTSEDVPEDWRANYERWTPDTSRFRAEAWQALEVWRLRRQRKTFSQIARTLGIKTPTAKKAFARAYELIEGRPYDPERFKQLYHELKVLDLAQTCTNCPLRDTCAEPCPDILPFLEQDQISRRELLTDHPFIS